MHTKGPWTVSKEHNGTFVRASHGGLVASAEAGNQTMRDVDARLIAAAPALLEALRAFVKARDMVGWTEGECDLWLGPAWEAARQAIRKAEG